MNAVVLININGGGVNPPICKTVTTSDRKKGGRL
nr:MAG TPA: hypothetical protein [Bacteriophage sp.]